MSGAKEQYQLAFDYVQNGQLDEAEGCLRDLIARFPEHPDVLHLLGVVLKNVDEVEESEGMLRSAVQKCPQNANYHYHLGLCLVKSGRPDKAAEAFANAVKFDPQLCNARYNLAKSLKDAGDLELSVRVYHDLLKHEPAHVEAIYNLANIYYEQDRLQEACELYTAVLSHEPAHTNARTNRALIQSKQGKRVDAIENLETVLKMEPEHNAAIKLLRKLNSQLISGWHIDMLNDADRNNAYNRAISRAAANARHVLEIGTGSGLLAMMAARAGAQEVTTCEISTPLAEVAAKIIQKNGYADHVRVINKKSTQLQLGGDLSKPADVLIAEVFDVGLLGENFLPALLHAKRNLLTKNALIIPASARIFGVLIECPELRSVNPIREIAGFDLSDFDIFRPPGYIQVDLGEINHRVLSDPIEICQMDFQKGDFLQFRRDLSVVPTSSGICHSIVFWFDLYLDCNTSISTRTGTKTNHWKQALHFFDNERRVESGQGINLIVQGGPTGLDFSMR